MCASCAGLAPGRARFVTLFLLGCGSQRNEQTPSLEEAMRSLLQIAAFVGATVACGVAAAQDNNDAPLTEKWAPAEWGADDRVGSPNRTTPELVLKAVGLVKQGKVATL